MRYFNTEGICRPDRHYMVRLDERMEKIKTDYVDRGSYFVINRGRQYGKTTTLRALADRLQADYVTLYMDFQKISSAAFENEYKFVSVFARLFAETAEKSAKELNMTLLKEMFESAMQEKLDMSALFGYLSRLCAASAKPVVLLIDEVDSASNNQIFLDFLALLRGYYLDRENVSTFQSVILAGVYDIKNLKLKIRPDEDHQYNSPWNIAARFHIRMSFSPVQIAAMLKEYEADHHTGMDVDVIAQCIYDYTSGYPYLVSAVCKLMDEDIAGTRGFENDKAVWSVRGVEEAVRSLLDLSSPLFESMIRRLYDHPEMKKMLYAILFQGRNISYNTVNQDISLAAMFGYIANVNGTIQVANRIFEICLYNLFLSEEEISNVIYGKAQEDKPQFIRNGRLDMDKVLERFVVHYTDIYGDSGEKFLEEQGRKLFLLYLKPIINGTGHYYVEACTRDAKRTDVIVDYLGEQFVVELKIWRGSEYHERGEQQLAEYLEYYHLEKGYLLSFNFNQKKEIGLREITVGGKKIVEAVI